MLTIFSDTAKKIEVEKSKIRQNTKIAVNSYRETFMGRCKKILGLAPVRRANLYFLVAERGRCLPLAACHMSAFLLDEPEQHVVFLHCHERGRLALNWGRSEV